MHLRIKMKTLSDRSRKTHSEKKSIFHKTNTKKKLSKEKVLVHKN